MFEDVVGENDIKSGVGPGDAASVSNFSFIQQRVIHDAGIEIDAANPRGPPLEVHLLDDARARAEIEDDRCRVEALEDALAE